MITVKVPELLLSSIPSVPYVMATPFRSRRLSRTALLLLALMPLVSYPLLVLSGHAEIVMTPIRLVARLLTEYPALLVLLFVFRLFLLLPVSVLLLLTGALHGLVEGQCIAIAGLTMGGLLEFLLIRHGVFGGNPTGALPATDDFVRRWRSRMARHPFATVLLLRMLMVPFDLVNIAAAWARIPTLPFGFATMAGVVPAAFPVIAAGSAISLDRWLDGAAPAQAAAVIDWRYATLSAGSLAASLAIGSWLRRRFPA